MYNRMCLALAFLPLIAQAKIQSECYDKSFGMIPSACFVAGTKIQTPDGEKAIEDLKIHDKVLSMNAKGEIVASKVSKIFVTRAQKTCRLVLVNGEESRVTPSHPFMKVPDYLQLEPGEMYFARVGSQEIEQAHFDYEDRYNKFFVGINLKSFVRDISRFKASLVKMSNQNQVGKSISSAERIKVQQFDHPAIEDVYNIEVENTHSYFANGLLVHNKPM